MSRSFLYLVLFIAVSLSACSTNTLTLNELRETKAELRVRKEERDMYRDKMEHLYAELERSQKQCLEKNFELQTENKQLQEVRRQYMLLQSSHGSLKDRYDQLENWSKALVEGYGPGIWKQSEPFFRPLYAKRPRVSSIQGIIDELNEHHRMKNNPLLVLKKVENRVVHLGVSDDRKLTTQMGSSGASTYLQTAAYSLNSLKGVDCVSFEIEEGDHAGPGKFCR